MMRPTLTISITEGKNGFLIGQIEEIPGVVSQGKTEEELKVNIIDALNLYFADMRDEYKNNKEITREETLIL